jgi:3-hydroxyacyl-CoA dehydrogenase
MTHVLAIVRDVGPQPFSKPRTVEDIMPLLKDCLKTLVQGRQANSVFLNTLGQVFGRRAAQEQEEDLKATENITSAMMESKIFQKTGRDINREAALAP